MSDADKPAPMSPRPRYLTPVLERLGIWTDTTIGMSTCPPGVPLCVGLPMDEGPRQ